MLFEAFCSSGFVRSANCGRDEARVKIERIGRVKMSRRYISKGV